MSALHMPRTTKASEPICTWTPGNNSSQTATFTPANAPAGNSGSTPENKGLDTHDPVFCKLEAGSSPKIL